MRVLVALCLCVAALLSSGCAIIDQELHNRGGYLDYLADSYWFKADSKKMRALRAYALEASLARLAAVSPKSDQDRKLMAIRVGDATERAQLVLKCAFSDNILPVPGAETDPCFFFDSLMVDYTTALFDLAMVALPIEDAKNLLNLLPTGATPDPAAALSALSGLVQLAKDALKYGRLIGAIYRDTMELEVQVWLAAPDQDQSNVPAPYVVTQEAVAELRGVYKRGNDDLAQWQAEIAALRSAGLEPIPDPKFIDEIAYLIYYLCGQITSDTATANGQGSLALCRSTTSPGTAWVAMWGIKAHKSAVLSSGIIKQPPATAASLTGHGTTPGTQSVGSRCDSRPDDSSAILEAFLEPGEKGVINQDSLKAVTPYLMKIGLTARSIVCFVNGAGYADQRKDLVAQLKQDGKIASPTK